MTFRAIPYSITWILVFLVMQAGAQVKRVGLPYVRSYQSADIQAGSQTWMIDFSDNGLAYFANNDGVIEFDGLHWRLFRMPGGIVVRCVMASDDGRVYAGGFKEIGYFEHDEIGEMKYVSLTDKIPQAYREFGEVWRIFELPSGIVFQSYEQLIILQEGTVKVIKAPGYFHFSFLVNNELYVNDQDEGLFRLAHDRLVKIPGMDPLRGQLIWSIVPKGDDFLISTADKGIYEFDGLRLKEWNNPASEMLKQNQVYCGLEISPDTYAFGTIQDGLLICDSSGNIVQHINLDRGLQNNTVLSIKLDRYNNLWLGLDNGIDYVEINSPLTYFTHYQRLSAGYTAVLHNNILYLGTNRGVFYQNWNKLKRGEGDHDFQLVPGTQGQVWELKVIDNTLFCGHNNGIFQITGTRAEKLSDVQGGWTFIQPQGREDLVICGTYTNLVKFEKKGETWGEGTKVKGFVNSSRYLVNAGQNMIWMSHGYIGVFRLHFNERFDSVTKVEYYNSNNGFPSDQNINVFKILNKTVFTTDNGIYQYDVRTNSFIPDSDLQGQLSGELIREMHEDEAGNIWYFTLEDAGVFRLQEDGSYLDVNVPFREMSGRFIKWFQFVYPIDRDNVLFGIQDGFVHYTPEFPKNYHLPLSAYIKTFKISGLDSVFAPTGMKDKSLLPSIPYIHNQLQFEFSANDFENPQRLQFSTYLEEFDDDWTLWQTRASREFTNLKHGQHTFRVKARNIFGTESQVVEVQFRIDPPWYLQWWTFIIYAFVLLLFIYLLVRYIRYRLEKSQRQEEERQQRIFRDREKQLETERLEAEKELIRLRNERLRSEMVQKDKELANNTMQMIQKSKSLIAIKRDLKKLSKEINDDLINNHIASMTRKINREIDTDNQWEVFEKHFESVHEKFLKDLKERYPELTPREMKLCAYLRLNISSKEIATLMNISTRGVEISRYRLRKKLKLAHHENLTDFIMSF